MEIRFRCDAPVIPGVAISESGTYFRRGLLGCLTLHKNISKSEIDDDYEKQLSEKILTVLKVFCTPLGEQIEQGLYNTVVSKIRQLAVDGALLKTARLLQNTMQNCVLVLRDVAHFVRTAAEQPLVRTGEFEEQPARLFNNKHALMKDIQFSDKLQAQLLECQKRVIYTNKSLGGSVTHLMRHFSFAPHRFESFAEPRRKLVCCYVAVVLLLIDIIADTRTAINCWPETFVHESFVHEPFVHESFVHEPFAGVAISESFVHEPRHTCPLFRMFSQLV